MNMPDVIKVIPVSVDAVVSIVPLSVDAFVSIVPSPGEKGNKGDKGDQGIVGPQGIKGDTGGSYEHDQTAISNIWTINHNLGYYPSINVVDSAGSTIETEGWYTNINTVEIRLSSGISGKAYLS